jgi:hypothetical protein
MKTEGRFFYSCEQGGLQYLTRPRASAEHPQGVVEVKLCTTYTSNYNYMHVSATLLLLPDRIEVR